MLYWRIKILFRASVVTAIGQTLRHKSVIMSEGRKMQGSGVSNSRGRLSPNDIVIDQIHLPHVMQTLTYTRTNAHARTRTHTQQVRDH